jgi:hypothetical protein
VLEATRPAVIAARGIDELHGDAQPIASPAHAPLHYRGDCQLPPDFTHVHAGIAKSERAAAAGNAQSGHAIERIDQLLRHTLAEGALVALRSHVGEWQYRDRRKVRADLVRHRRDETVAVAVPRLDVTWLPCLVGQRLAQLLNARGERIVADHDAVPDRGEQIVPAHRLAGALQQHAEHFGALPRQPDLAVRGPKPAADRLERIPAESDPSTRHAGHGTPPRVELVFILQFYRMN